MQQVFRILPIKGELVVVFLTDELSLVVVPVVHTVGNLKARVAKIIHGVGRMFIYMKGINFTEPNERIFSNEPQCSGG